jgi:hypothetical protein
MTARHKRIALFILLFWLAWSAAWYILAGMAESRLLRQLDAAKAVGLNITVAAHRKSGYPFALHLTLKDFVLSDKSGITLATPRLILGASLLDATHATLHAPRDTLATVPAEADRAAVEATIADVAGDMHFGLAGMSDMAVTLKTISVAGLMPAEKPLTAQSIAITLEKPQPGPTDHTQAGAHVVANVTKLFLPIQDIPSLGNTIDRVTLDAVLMGKVPQLTETSLAAWRDEGGTVEVHELSGQWNDLNFSMDGTLALDPAFQPEGSFNARIQGFDQGVDALAGTHAIKGQYADLLKMGLSMLAKPEGDQDVPTLHIPVTIQDRALYLSHFRIMGLRAVHLF